ncbi:MAG: hypothetical protein GY705_28115 [Bacteroidetes bacterium]|nr:hypothetical protein [Bacteroidota bacterium]
MKSSNQEYLLMNKALLVLLLFAFSLGIGCMIYEEEKQTEVNIDIKNKKIQRLFDYQDKQLTDSLYPYFEHSDPTLRYLSTMAFASIKDTAVIVRLTPLLKDEVEEIRIAAAYALGQTGDQAAENSLIQAFEQLDTQGVFRHSNAAILEAIGKTGSEDQLKNLSSIKSYQPRDTALLSGQALGIYRFALRNIVSPEGTQRMIELATNQNYPENVRLIAANYLSRTKNIQLGNYANTLAESIKVDNPNIRMALVIALGKAGGSAALRTLLDLFDKEDDYRVKCNILRAFPNLSYGDVQATAVKAMSDKNLHIATRAAQFFLESGIPQDATFYWRTASEGSYPWQVKTILYEASNKHLPAYLADYRNSINVDTRQQFMNTTDAHAKGAYLKALAEFGWNYRFIKEQSFNSTSPIIQIAGIEALSKIASHPEFRRIFGLSYRRITRDLAAYFGEAIRSDNPTMIAVAAGALRTPERGFITVYDSLDVLENVLSKVELPRNIETYNELKHTIEFFKGNASSFIPEKTAYNHPIDWAIIDAMTDRTSAIIRTQKGNIKLEFLPEYAPGSVANFITLTQTGFYDGKNFHRIVPNFVIQGGCPRGDGFGNLDYSIRSELPNLHYNEEGYVGMASSGNHTESSQFFITHSPTLHLDGNYTIFAKVTEGMDVVHEIQIGDRIERVIINNLKE